MEEEIIKSNRSDKPTKDDKFDRSSFVDVIFNTIDTSTESFNLGISARWGEGKSSILEQLQPRLEKADYKVLRFEPWKYTQDKTSIKRKFLIDIYRQLDNKDLDTELLYLNQEKEKDIDITEQNKKLFDYGAKFTAYFIFTLIIMWFLIAVWHALVDSTISISKTLLETLVVPALGGLLPFFQKISEIKVKQVIPKIETAEQFEDLFNKAIEGLMTSKSAPKKVVIFVDDLDRCDHVEVEQVLTALFTFFNNENCIYVITADHTVIRRYITKFLHVEEENDSDIEKTKQDRERQATEYLKKIFQINFILPKITADKLDPWVDDLLKDPIFEFKNKFAKENLLSIIKNNLESNPRKIKHFVRTLSFQIQIVKEKIKKTDITATNELKALTIVKESPELLGKILLIQDRFPEFYEKLSDTKSLIKQIETSDTTSLANDVQKLLSDPDLKKLLGEEPRFYNSAYRNGEKKNIDPYYFLYFSGTTGYSEIQTPDPTQILSLSKSANTEDLKKIFNGLTDQPRVIEIERLLTNLNKSTVDEQNLVRSIFSIIPTIEDDTLRDEKMKSIISISTSRKSNPIFIAEISSLGVPDFENILPSISKESIEEILKATSPYYDVRNSIYSGFINVQEKVSPDVDNIVLKNLSDDLKGDETLKNRAIIHISNLKKEVIQKSREFQNGIVDVFKNKEKPIKKELIKFLSTNHDSFEAEPLSLIKEDINNLVQQDNIESNVFILSELSNGLGSIINTGLFTDALCSRIKSFNGSDTTGFKTLIDNSTAPHVRTGLGEEKFDQIIKTIISETNSADQNKRLIAITKAEELIGLAQDKIKENLIVNLLKSVSENKDVQDEKIINTINSTKENWRELLIKNKDFKNILLKIEKSSIDGSSIRNTTTTIIDFFNFREKKKEDK